MPSSDTDHVDSPAGNIERVLTVARGNAFRMRVLSGICAALVGFPLLLQIAAIASHKMRASDAVGVILVVCFEAAVLGIVVYQLLSQSRTLRAIEESTALISEDEERNRISGLTVAEALVSVDGDGRITYFNYAAERVFGRSASSVMGRPVGDLIPSRLHDGYRAELRRLLERGTPETIGEPVEVVCLRREGDEFPVEVSIAHVKDNKHEFFTAVVRDISERKRTEAAFKNTEERFRLLIQNVRDYAILTLDPSGCVTTWSEGAERIKGYTSDEIIGKYFSIFYPQEDVEAGKPEFELRTAAREGRFEDVGWRVRKDGSRFWANVILTALKDDDGAIRGYAKITRDISDRKRIEDENRRLNEGLEKRNAELANTNKELEAFTYSVAHDLRSPLRHIAGFSKILAEEYGPTMEAEAREYLGDIQQGATRMGALIEDLLNLAKINRQEVNFQIAGLRTIVDNVIKSLSAETKGREIEWRIDDLPYIQCDPTLITQVYSNLLSNSVKYTRPRNPAIIRIGRTEIEGETVLFVKDNGVGFNMNYADKLFGVFQRLHRSEDFEGTGVGLATVQRIIHKHGGRIWAEAELDKGASFYFTIGSPADRNDTPDSIAPSTFRTAEPPASTPDSTGAPDVSSEPTSNPAEMAAVDPNVVSPALNGAETVPPPTPVKQGDGDELVSESRERSSLNVR